MSGCPHGQRWELLHTSRAGCTHQVSATGIPHSYTLKTYLFVIVLHKLILSKTALKLSNNYYIITKTRNLHKNLWWTTQFFFNWSRNIIKSDSKIPQFSLDNVCLQLDSHWRKVRVTPLEKCRWECRVYHLHQHHAVSHRFQIYT